MPDAAHYPTLFTFRLHIRRWLLLLPILSCLLIIVGCILYLTHSYTFLRDWYLGLFPCIYKAAEWPQKFFSPTVKYSGNYYCIAGIALATILLAHFVRQYLRKQAPVSTLFRLTRPDA